jgi:hypothetical protein
MLPLINKSSNLDDEPRMTTPFSAIRHTSDSLRLSRRSHPPSTPRQHQDRTSGPSISNILIHQTRTSRNGTHRQQPIPRRPGIAFHSSYLFRQPRSPLMQKKFKPEGRRLRRNQKPKPGKRFDFGVTTSLSPKSISATSFLKRSLQSGQEPIAEKSQQATICISRRLSR